MSARPGEWQLLGHGSDPVPHRTYALDRLADTYEQTGEAIRESADRLRRLAELDGWTGDAAEAFAEAAEDLHGDLADAEQRYVDAGAALRRFVEPVREARSESYGALSDAERAQEEKARNGGDTLAGVAEPTPEQVDAQARRAGRLEAAEQDLMAARTRLDRALSALGTAADRAARDIRDAAEHGKDSRWDNVKGGMRDFADAVHLKTLVEIVGWVALAVAVVAAGLALFATAPFWLVALAIGLGVALLAGDLVLWSNGSGDAEWYNVGLDVVGLATLGLARPLTGAATATTVSTRGGVAAARGATAQADEAARLAALPDSIRATNASGMPVGNNLRTWSDSLLAGNTTRAADAGTDGAARVQAGAAGRPGPLQSARHLDSDLAQTAAEIRRLRALDGANPATARLLEQAERQVAVATANGYAGLGTNVLGGVDLTLAAMADEPPTHGAPRDALRWRLSDYEPEPAR